MSIAETTVVVVNLALSDIVHILHVEAPMRSKVELCFPETAVSGKVTAEKLSSAIPADKLKKIISSARKKGGQIIIFTRSGKILSELPARRTTIRSGEMTAVIYGDYLK